MDDIITVSLRSVKSKLLSLKKIYQSERRLESNVDAEGRFSQMQANPFLRTSLKSCFLFVRKNFGQIKLRIKFEVCEVCGVCPLVFLR